MSAYTLKKKKEYVYITLYTINHNFIFNQKYIQFSAFVHPYFYNK